MSEAGNGARSPLEGVRVVEMGSLLAGPFCGQLPTDFSDELKEVQYNDAVYGEVQGSGEEEQDSLRERGII